MRKKILSLPVLKNYVRVSAILSLLVIVFMHPNNLAIGAFLCLIALFLGYMEGSYRAILFAILLGGVIPTLCEMLAVHRDVWNYTQPSILGVPFWLPLAWGIASFVTSKALNRFAPKMNKSKNISHAVHESEAA